MNSQKNGRNHFLVGQEMNGSVVVSCIETKSPSGNRWLKIHREFKLKNGSKFWLDKLISREKGEETLADWLEEQAQLRAKKEAAQAKAREMAKKRIQARNGEGLAPAAHSTKPVKTKLELPSKKHKAATIQSSSNTVKKPASLKPSTKSHNTGMDPVGQTQISFTDKDGSEVETQSSMPRIPKSPKRTQKPASARTLLREENTADVEKSPKKPTSLRTKTFHSGDDIEASPKKESSGRLQVDVSPSGKATKRSSSRDRKLRSRRESSRKAKKEAEENAHVEAEEMALRAAEEKARFETEELARQEAEEKARVEAEEMARREAEQKARFEAEELARQEAEEKACVEAEEMAQREAEQKARLEAEELARQEAEEKVRVEAEEMAQRESEQKARLEAEELARQEAEEKTRVEAEEMAQREAEQKARLEAVENATVENATLTKQAEERGRVEELSHVDEESQRIEHSKDEAGEKSLVETLDGERQSLGTADLIANLPDDEHSSTAVVEKTPPLPYDEVLADSGSRLAHSDSDIDTKKKRRKKKEIASAKSEDKKRRKPKGKRLGELGSEASGMDLHESSIIETKRRKSKTPTESRDWASAGSGMDLSDSSKNKKKKKKKKDSRKDNDTDASHDELEQSQNSFRAHDSKTKKKTKKKKKEKGENSASTKTNKEKQKEAVVSDIHTQLEAMFELPVEVQLVGIEEVADDSNKFQNVPMVPPFKDDDSDDEGSAEFHVDPSMMDNPLDDYSSDEPSSDSDDDFDYTRVAGINDFDNNGVGMNQRASALHSSKVIVDAAADAEDSGHDEQGEEAISPGLESKENMNFSSLEEMKDVSPSFAKIMGVWVERENKVLYRTPLETVDKKGDGKKEVPVPAGPEAPSLGSMVKKWEAKFIKEEAEKTEDAPRKLKNVWAEKLEFTKPFTKPSHNKSADDIKLIEDTVEKNFAFKDLTLDEMAPIIDAFERVEYDLGATIGQQGEPEGFYSIVQSGEVAFHSDGNKVGSAVAGDAFGELSLLYSVPLAAEAKAVGNETVLFQLNRMDFRHIVREQMIRSEEEKLKLLQSVEVFKNLDETDLRQLASAMTPHQFNIGQNLTSTFAEAPFCLVQQGSVSATDVPIGPGESFGEKYLIAKENKRYEVKALSDGTAFTIDRESFEKVFGDFDRVSMKYRDKQTLVRNLIATDCFRHMFVI
jgi:CRP-like cAMP-binding protein